ncbi:MAG TPA: hypothetical protein VNY31_07185 [Solirubrobacteraceae bacterium]|jgi:hypothetical protein|nr:hypothetical protein [Solirubrobacteraceae bacterium]
MGFLARRRSKKWITSLNQIGEESDRLVELPLSDEIAQEIREAVEARLAAEWKMPAGWAALGVEYTNARGDGADEADAYAFTDALVFGYTLREVESARPDGRPVPADIATLLKALPARADDVLQAVVDLAESRVPDILILSGEAWDDFDYWAGQFNRARSRGRRRQDRAIAPLPATVDYEHALLFGYALRCCAEVRGDDPFA